MEYYKSNKTFRESTGVTTQNTKRQKKDNSYEVPYTRELASGRVLNKSLGMEFYSTCNVVDEAVHVDNNKPIYSESTVEFHTNYDNNGTNIPTRVEDCLSESSSEDSSDDEGSSEASTDENENTSEDASTSEDENDENEDETDNHESSDTLTQEVKNDKVLCSTTNDEDCKSAPNTNELIGDEKLDFEVIGHNAIKLHDDFNKPITLRQLPESLEELVLGNSYNQPFIKGALPDSLKFLTFGDEFNQFIDVVTLPPNLKKITFGSKFNQRLVKGMFPNSVEEIIFGRDFNQSLVDCKDPNLLSKTNSGSFFKNLFSLFSRKHVPDMSSYSVCPPNLKIMSLGYNFNQPILKDVLPKTLVELKISTNYKHPLDINVSKSVV